MATARRLRHPQSTARWPALLVLGCLALTLLVGACGPELGSVGEREIVITPESGDGQTGVSVDGSAEALNTPAIVPNPADDKVTITLFFNSRSGLLLPWPWRRTVERPQRTAELARRALEHLLEPPGDSPFVSALPRGTRILSVEVDDRQQVAYVNFSQELVDNHPGGSYGEGNTIHAIVQTLTGIPGIRRVQILVEGKTVETVAGHVSTQEPLERVLVVPPSGDHAGPVSLDGAFLPQGDGGSGPAAGAAGGAAVPSGTAARQGTQGAGGGSARPAGDAGDGSWTPWQMQADGAVIDFFQRQVSEGRMQWLTDPVEAARYLTTTYGFFGWDEFVLLHRTERGEGSGLGEALVRVRHGDSYYTVTMIQPRVQGDLGIWVVHDIRPRTVVVGRKPVDGELVRAWQMEVQQGSNLWRLDPVDTVRRTGALYGFDPYSDEFVVTEINRDRGEALVGVKHDGRYYRVRLVQPAVRGQRGVWWIESILPDLNAPEEGHSGEGTS